VAAGVLKIEDAFFDLNILPAVGVKNSRTVFVIGYGYYRIIVEVNIDIVG
jgi:hypothetical protein